MEDVSDIVREARTVLYNRFSTEYDTLAAGGANSDFIVLCGGGYVDVYDKVIELLSFNPERIYRSEDDSSAASTRPSFRRVVSHCSSQAIAGVLHGLLADGKFPRPSD